MFDAKCIGNETDLPDEIIYILKSVRIFGNFEKPLIFALCKHVVSMTVSAGKHIFEPGQMDECIYIVKSGQLNLNLVYEEGKEMLLKKVKAGENIHSVMNILDALRGSNFKYSIRIRAAVDSEILMLPSRAFKEVFEDYPESLVRVVQMIMLRLQQMIFQVFHKSLGLPSEIIISHSQDNESLKSLSVYSLEKDEKKIGCFLQKTVTSSVGCLNYHISSINKQESESTLTDNSSIGQHKNFTKTQKTNLVELYGKANEMHGGLSSATSDFDAVLDCVGLKGSSDDILQNQVADDFFSSIIGKLEVDESYGIPSEKEEKIMAAARADLVKLLQLPTPKLLDGLLNIDVVPCGTYLVKEGDKDSGLFFLVQGLLEVSQTLLNQKEVLFTCVPGEFMGSLSLLTGDPSFFTIYTKEVSYVVVISKVNFYKLVKQHAKVVLPVANSTIQKMSSFIRNTDFALDWFLQESGKPLFRQNETPDSLYVVLNGRLRVVCDHKNKQEEIVHEYGRGEFVGLVETLTREKKESVYALRDTELAQIPEGLLSTIKKCYPQVVSPLIQLLGKRFITKMKRGSRINVADSKLEKAKNIRTLAVIPASNSVPLHNFTFELGLAISKIDATLVLTSDVIKQRLGDAILENIHECNLSNWLSHQEAIHKIVVYQADMTMTKWTERCIRQADAIMIVGRVDEDPQVGKLEEQLVKMTLVRTQKNLILLHDEESFVQPTNTSEWLNARVLISAHYHIRCPKKIFKRELLSEDHVNDPNYQLPSIHSDFARLARVLTGTSYGLVLGGGGARGIAHIGIIRALRKAGIPIDSVGGTSMGAFIGALYAEKGSISKTINKGREGCGKMASMWNKILDMTFPHTSLFTGKAFNSVIQSTIGDIKIEDMLLPYFCVTTDINDSKIKIHQTGCCWRYVRASMSLSGYLPPMCDPVDGHLLLDGGYVNNLPGDIMRSLGVKTIICVDVGSEEDLAYTNFGDSLSGWWTLWNKINPFASPVEIPDLHCIHSRLAYISCVGKLEEIKNSCFYNYIRPPIDRFTTLQFGSFDEILDCGYHHGKDILKTNHLAFGGSNKLNKKLKQITVHKSIASSFTDLVELVSQIKPTTKISIEDSEDDEDLSKMEYERERAAKNLVTLAVIPASNSVPLHNFTFELGLAINDIGATLVLTSDVIKQRMGNAILESINECKLSNWLSHQEDTHKIVVYQADMMMTAWTKICIRQADAIMIVGRVDEDPQVGKLEEQLKSMPQVKAQKDLILLHDEESFVQPTNTSEWLNARKWISAHYHIRCPKKVFNRKFLSEDYVNDPNYQYPSKHSDFARLARLLTGTSIGLVLGGGGAKGIAHIGIIEALREAGIPIDSVGGTSMGAFIGALYAEQGSVSKTINKGREGCGKMASMWGQILDMTLPHTSLFTGKAFNSVIQSTIGDIKIEDMLLPYYCVTTDINDSKIKIHQTGCCWRYVRASMSLCGYLPPICDPIDDHLLLDGGYVNNLPGDIMRSLGVKNIICVDVGSEDENNLTNFGDQLSGWWMLWNKLNPFASPVNVPDMNGIQSRLAFISSVWKIEEIKNSSFYNYIRPPINRFKTLQFGSFDEILDCGYHHGKAILEPNRLAFGGSNELNKNSKQELFSKI